MKKLNWKATTQEDRIIAIEQIKTTISSNNGCITHFNMFSDLAMSLTIEVEEKDISQLHNALQTITHISELENEKASPTSITEWTIFMNITFGKGTGKLTHDTLAVPG